ncbi:unnamed protein product [Gongylonema pulchrum]|uniref:Uncharacterized protein n=1 Tax=Gongylonema pulchrum TaxID=637853 RepID=A0A183D900_9BILA|nr:unnamed protein product [Gongylonema pulchrum]
MERKYRRCGGQQMETRSGTALSICEDFPITLPTPDYHTDCSDRLNYGTVKKVLTNAQIGIRKIIKIRSIINALHLNTNRCRTSPVMQHFDVSLSPSESPKQPTYTEI